MEDEPREPEAEEFEAIEIATGNTSLQRERQFMDDLDKSDIMETILEENFPIQPMESADDVNSHANITDNESSQNELDQDGRKPTPHSDAVSGQLDEVETFAGVDLTASTKAHLPQDYKEANNDRVEADITDRHFDRNDVLSEHIMEDVEDSIDGGSAADQSDHENIASETVVQSFSELSAEENVHGEDAEDKSMNGVDENSLRNGSPKETLERSVTLDETNDSLLDEEIALQEGLLEVASTDESSTEESVGLKSRLQRAKAVEEMNNGDDSPGEAGTNQMTIAVEASENESVPPKTASWIEEPADEGQMTAVNGNLISDTLTEPTDMELAAKHVQGTYVVPIPASESSELAIINREEPSPTEYSSEEARETEPSLADILQQNNGIEMEQQDRLLTASLRAPTEFETESELDANSIEMMRASIIPNEDESSDASAIIEKGHSQLDLFTQDRNSAAEQISPDSDRYTNAPLDLATSALEINDSISRDVLPEVGSETRSGVGGLVTNSSQDDLRNDGSFLESLVDGESSPEKVLRQPGGKDSQETALRDSIVNYEEVWLTSDHTNLEDVLEKIEDDVFGAISETVSESEESGNGEHRGAGGEETFAFEEEVDPPSMFATEESASNEPSIPFDINDQDQFVSDGYLTRHSMQQSEQTKSDLTARFGNQFHDEGPAEESQIENDVTREVTDENHSLLPDHSQLETTNVDFGSNELSVTESKSEEVEDLDIAPIGISSVIDRSQVPRFEVARPSTEDLVEPGSETAFTSITKGKTRPLPSTFLYDVRVIWFSVTDNSMVADSGNYYDYEPTADVEDETTLNDEEIWRRIEPDFLREEEDERINAATRIQSSFRRHRTHRSGIYHSAYLHLFSKIPLMLWNIEMNRRSANVEILETYPDEENETTPLIVSMRYWLSTHVIVRHSESFFFSIIVVS